jgi:hypothetical protein
MRTSSPTTLTTVCVAIGMLIGASFEPAFAQTSRIDSLTHANPDFLGLQAAGSGSVEGCCQPSLSDDGRHVLFLSVARNLVAGDHNNNIDLFVRDRVLGTTQRVNLRSDGAQGRSGDAASVVGGAISADGDLVVFSSRQFDLVAGDTNLASDVFLHQRSTGVTTRIVSGIGGAEADQGASNPSLSADGRYVVFESGSTNLAPGQLGTLHVYLLDRNSGVIERISVTPSGTASSSGGGATNATVSDDGRFVAFESSANDLVATPGNGQAQLYVRDRQLGITLRLSQVGGALADAAARNSMIAGNGSRVVFETAATNLDASDTNGVEDIYVVSIATGAINRVSVSNAGAQAAQRSRRPSISRNGQRVSFDSSAELAAGGTTQFEQVYLRDLDLQTTTLVSVNNQGSNGNRDEFEARLSGNGQVVSFGSSSTDLDPPDTNNLSDRFVRDLTGNTTERISLADASGPFPSQANGDSTSSIRGQRQLSADGRFLVTQTTAKNLGFLNLTGTSNQIVRVDRQGNLVRLISADINGAQAISAAFDPAISADGRFIVFRSSTTNLVVGDSNNASDIFWLDADNGGLERVNLGPGNVQGLGGATTTLPSVADDGNAIAFVSNQNNLVVGDSNAAQDIFVRDRATSTTTRVSVDSAGAQANGLSDFPVISANGRFVVFSSLASNLVAGDAGGFQDIFRHDRQTGQTVLVSQSSTGTQGNNNSFISAISADGNRIAFSSSATNLVNGDSNARTDIFVRDVTQGTTTLVSVSSAGELGNGTCSVPSISADGQVVTFLSGANNLVSGDNNNLNDLFRHDLQSGQTLRVSVDPDGRQVRAPQATVSAGQISPDGSRVAIETTAADFELTLGVAGARSVMLVTAAEPPAPEDIFANGFE